MLQPADNAQAAAADANRADAGSKHVLSGPTALELELAAAAAPIQVQAAAAWQQPYAGGSAVAPFPSELPRPSAPLFSGGVPAHNAIPAAAFPQPGALQHQQPDASLQALAAALAQGQQPGYAGQAAGLAYGQNGMQQLPSPPPPAGLPMTSGLLARLAQPSNTGAPGPSFLPSSC
jgi:hypothetical protein